MVEQVVLVDENDVATGMMPKLEAHEKGVLHRAFSVFIFNLNGDMLLQQRAFGKYHSAGLWSNACCSHPRPGEQVYDAAIRRLYEEMGIKCRIKEVFSFIYEAQLENGLTEHEFDHVFIGLSDDEPKIDSAEVAGWRYIEHDQLMAEIKDHPENYTEWFKLCLTAWHDKIFLSN